MFEERRPDTRDYKAWDEVMDVLDEAVVSSRKAQANRIHPKAFRIRRLSRER